MVKPTYLYIDDCANFNTHIHTLKAFVSLYEIKNMMIEIDGEREREDN